MKIMRPKRPTTVPTVSVVIPCYNYGHFLPEVVGGILAQERVQAKVIIVDDCSPDGSAAIAAVLVAADARVSLIAHDHNMGHIATYNDGLAQVDSEFAVLLSADDLLAPGALARAIDLMVCHPSVGMVYGYPCEFQDGGERGRGRARGPHTWTVWTGAAWTSLACRRGRNFILSPEVVMRTSALKEIGGYNPKLPHSGDLEFWLRTAAAWDIGRINGPVQAYYRVHGGNMHLTRFATMTVDLRHRLEAFRVLERTAPRQLRKAERALAREAVILATQAAVRGQDVEAAHSLLDFAETRTGRLGTWRLPAAREAVRRALAGEEPRRAQRAVALARTQVDRARWRLWAATGVS